MECGGIIKTCILNCVVTFYHKRTGQSTKAGHIIHSVLNSKLPILADHLQIYHVRINLARFHQIFRRSLFSNTTVRKNNYFICAAYGTHTVGRVFITY